MRRFFAITLAFAVAGDARAQSQACTTTHRCIARVASSSIGLGPQWRLEVDATDVYFISRGAVIAAGKPTGLARVVAGGYSFPCAAEPSVDAAADFLVDASSVYWMTLDRRTICRVGHAPAAQLQRVVRLADGTIGAFALGPSTIYYSVRLGDRHELRAVSRHGGASRTVATTALTPDHIVSDATYVYWIEPSGLHRLRHGGGTVDVIGGNLPVVTSLVVDHGSAYVSTHSEVARLAPSATQWTTLVKEAAEQIAVDDTSVYFASDARGAVLKVPITGGPVIVLAPLSHPRGIAVDGSSVCVSDLSTYDVMRITPK